MAAYSRRSLTSGFTLISRRYLHPPLSSLLPNSHDRDQSKSQPQAPPSSNPQSLFRSPIQSGSRTLGFSLPLGLDPLSRSYSSSPSSAAMDGSNEIGFIKDDVLIDPAAIETSSSAAAASVPLPFPGEVAAAAADSYPPVAALQYLIDAVHSISGVNWWLSIALTTLLIRSATVPLLVYQMKATTKLSAIRPQMEELKERAQSSMDPQVMRENQKKMKELFKKHGVNPFTPLMGLFIQGPVFISFFMAISNMVEKVPSFKGGGAYWFTDLTTPDPFYALPVLTGLTFLATVELNMQEGMEGNPMAATMKKFSRGLAVLSVPFTASFPKAIFCYWVTSNLFSLVYGLVMKHKPVRKFLNLPDITPPSDSGPAFSLGEPKGGPPDSGPGNGSSSAALPATGSEPKRISSSAVINQRIRNLEKQVKGRNKPPKKRRNVVD